MAIYVLMCR